MSGAPVFSAHGRRPPRGRRTFCSPTIKGSIVAYANYSGVKQAIYTYGPWGEPTDEVGNANWTGPRFRYTGQLALPEVRLYYYKARVYDPVMGRFLQTDPIGSKDDLNLYAYVAGDPVNKTDPTGKAHCRTCVLRSQRESSLVTTDNADGSRTITRTRVSYKSCGGSPCGRSVKVGTVTLLPQNQTAAGVPAAPTEAMTNKLLTLSEKTGKTVEVSSGYRTQAQQDALRIDPTSTSRAATQSQHTYGDAADIRISGMSQQEVAKAAANSGLFERVNKYSNGDTHVDMMDAGPGTTTYQNWERKPYE